MATLPLPWRNQLCIYPGQVVKIQAVSGATLQLAEVEVYGPVVERGIINTLFFHPKIFVIYSDNTIK